MFEQLRKALGKFVSPISPKKTLGECLADLGREEGEAQEAGIALWERDRNPYHCSRHNGRPPEPTSLTVDEKGRPVCWMCIGLFGLAYDHRKRWNPDAQKAEMVETTPGLPITGQATPIGLLGRR